MKKRFTKFFAALALLAFFIPSFIAMGQTTYEQLTSIASIDETAQYVLGIDGTGFHYTGTSSWGKTALPSAQTPIYYTLTKATDGNSFTAQATIDETTYYLQIPTTNTFSMATETGTNTDIIIGTTQVSGTNYAVANKNTTARHLRINGTSGLRSYAGTTGTMAFFYKVVPASGTTYTVTYHANVSGVADIEEIYNEGSTVTIANNTFSNPGYAFTEWNTEADGNGESFAPGDEIEDIDDDLELYAQWEESSELTLTFPLTSNPGGWPTANETTLTDYTYTLDGVNYTFALKNVKCNSGYILVTQVGVVGLPAIEGYKLTKVVASNSGGCSTSVNVGISSSASQANYIEGGAAQTWSSQGSQYTYNLTSTESNTMYYMYVTSKNAQITNLALTYEAAAAPAIATPTFDPANGATFGNEGLTVTIACETPNTVIYYTVDGSTPDNNSTLYEGAITLTTTATIKAIAYDGTNYSNVATATYTYIDPNAPGTENNPYTVAQARAAIDANTGITGVYATGIVSAIPTAWSTQYNNITFNFVDEEGDNNFLQAYRCGSGTGVDASEVAVGDIVVVYGSLTKHNTTYEFGQGCQLVSLTHPAVAVEAPTFSPEAGTYTEAQSVTISCESPSTIYYYTLDGTEPTPNSTLYSEPIPVSSTTTIKAVAYAGGDDHSTVATANYYFCSEGDPYTVTEALSFAEYQYPANGIYVQGVVSTVATSVSNGTLTYYISEDGTTDNQLEVYKGKDLDNEAFTAANDLQLGDIVTVYGNVVIYGTSNPIKEFAQGNYLVSFYRPVVSNITISPNRIDATAAGADGTLNITYSGLEIGDMTDFEIVYLDIDGDPIDQPNWIEVTVAEQDLQEGEGYVVSYIIDENDGDARTVYFQVFAPSLDDDFVYSNTVTVEQAEYVEPTTYTLASSIISGKTYIISNGVDRAMGAQNGTLRSAAAVSIDDNNVATVTSADVYEFVITGSAEDGYTIYDVKDEGYLYASSSSNNNIGTRAENSDGNSMWTIEFDESAVTISANGENTRKFIRYNYNNGNDRFSCYAETSSLQDPLYLFVKDEAPVVETYTRTILGYGDNDQVKTGWYLIATPVQINIAPNTMVSDNYDLFRFNQSAVGSEWENYKNEEHSDFTVLEPCKGYLYAHSETIDLSFTGTPYSGDGEIELTYDADATLAGWNLIGNPFGEAAYLENNYPFYKMNDNGDGLITPGPNDDRRIKLMEGIFVQATAQIDKVTFVRSYEGKRGNSEIALNIIGSNNNVIDRAIVRLNEGYTLEKFTLNEDDTKIYIPQADADYAIVCSNGEGTMPVNFKAKEMGKYTISVETEGIDINYLHLIDRLTGEDVNLLIDNSYSFIASNNDNESRFILSFNENAYNANEAFAFQNGSDIIVNGNGTLQVFDATGRMVMNTTINGMQTVNMPNGVYVLRMIGETVNTQKIVVR